jgi:hypothetical protein
MWSQRWSPPATLPKATGEAVFCAVFHGTTTAEFDDAVKNVGKP